MTTVHYKRAPKRKPYNPQVGDKKIVKGVTYVRVFRRVPKGRPGAGALMMSGGRHLYEWVKEGEQPC